jgi:hypothetical protein
VEVRRRWRSEEVELTPNSRVEVRRRWSYPSQQGGGLRLRTERLGLSLRTGLRP